MFNIPEERRFRPQSPNVLIAHAGGGIDGFVYTNSLESILLARENGYQFIELDLRLSTDGKIVAVHEWPDFHRETGGSGDKAVSAEEFLSRRIRNRYTPLGAEAINAFFARHPDLFLVTDKLTDFEAINGQLTIPRERLLVEVFSLKEYATAFRRGIKYPMLCIWDVKSFLELWPILARGKVAMITLPGGVVGHVQRKLRTLHAMGVASFVFTLNDPGFLRSFGGDAVSGVYTDWLTNRDLKVCGLL